MKNRIVVFIMTFVLIICLIPKNAVFANSDIVVLLDNVKVSFDQAPVLQNSRTYVQMRAIFEAFGYTVEWDEKYRQIEAEKLTATTKTVCWISLETNSLVAMHYDYENKANDAMYAVMMEESAPILVGGRTLLPLRLLGEALGIKVDWNAGTRTVILDSTNQKMISMDIDERKSQNATTEPVKPKDEAVETAKTNDTQFVQDPNNQGDLRYQFTYKDVVIDGKTFTIRDDVTVYASAPSEGDLPAKIVKDTSSYDPYDYKDFQEAYQTPSLGTCPWYVDGRVMEVYGVQLAFMQFLGNGGQYFKNAENHPFLIRESDLDSIEPLSLVVYNDKKDDSGHVMFIEYIERDSNGKPTFVYCTDANGIGDLNKGKYDYGYDGAVLKFTWEKFLARGNRFAIGYLKFNH